MVEDSLTLFKREMLIFKANLRTNIVRSLIFPLVIIIFFGNIGNSIRNTPVAVVNYANNAQSLQFMNALSTDQVINILSETNEQSALSMLQLGNVQLVVVILPNFPSSDPSSPGIQVYYSNTQPTTIAAVLPVIKSYAQHFEASGISTMSAMGVSASSSPNPATSGGISSSSLYSTTSNYLDFLIGGLLAMVVVFSALFTGGMAYISDRQLGIIKAFLITPINKNAIVLSRILSGAAQGILTVTLALGVGILFGVTVAMGFVGLLYILAVTIIVGMGFSALSMAVASKVKRVDAYAMFAQAIGMPLWFISGGIVPTASLPTWLQPFSVVDPLTYATQISRAVIMQGFISTSQAVTDFSILIVFTAALIVIGFKTFNSTIE